MVERAGWAGWGGCGAVQAPAHRASTRRQPDGAHTQASTQVRAALLLPPALPCPAAHLCDALKVVHQVLQLVGDQVALPHGPAGSK